MAGLDPNASVGLNRFQATVYAAEKQGAASGALGTDGKQGVSDAEVGTIKNAFLALSANDKNQASTWLRSNYPDVHALLAERQG
jgi:hypothetical protein